MSENNKCVYLHKDKEGVVRYVGSGTVRRAHLKYAKSYRGKLYEDFVLANGKLNVEIIFEGLSKIEAEDLERELYNKYIDTILNKNSPGRAKVMTKSIFEEYLYYDETSSSGVRWKVDTGRAASKTKANSEAGYLNNSKGYYVIGLKGNLYYAHRIIAVLHDLDVEGKVIDHIDRNKTNNRIENLRVVSQKENMQNLSQQKLSSNNTTGFQGVHCDRNSSWVARWYEEGKRKAKYFAISKYNSSEEAFNAACEYRQSMIKLHYNQKELNNDTTE